MSNNNEIEEDAPIIENQEAELNDAVEVNETEAEEVVEKPVDEMTALKEALVKAEAKATDNYNLALRTKAESENAKRRQESDLSNARKFALEKFATDLLPVLDSMEMGLSAATDEAADVTKFQEGSEMAIKMFIATLEKFGAVPVNPQGEKFSPDLHQAMSMVENKELAPNTVLNVVQKGFTLNGRLIRPAMVIVSKGGPVEPPPSKIDEIV